MLESRGERRKPFRGSMGQEGVAIGVGGGDCWGTVSRGNFPFGQSSISAFNAPDAYHLQLRDPWIIWAKLDLGVGLIISTCGIDAKESGARLHLECASNPFRVSLYTQPYGVSSSITLIVSTSIPGDTTSVHTMIDGLPLVSAASSQSVFPSGVVEHASMTEPCSLAIGSLQSWVWLKEKV